MTAPASLFDFAQTPLPTSVPSLNLGETNRWNQPRSASRAMPAPRMIKSVVDEAGLGKFVYLQGISGRRYVFSSIRPEQAALYDHALFAVTDWGQGEQPGIRVAASASDVSANGHALYVHLLDDEDRFGYETLEDLCS
ncbi:MAG: hypothetical protein HRU27_01760 [Rhizobiaceae bacterium]|nr:hypothetical protein [Hyphomicrobiales bacterium]NRB29304.1 hypothetical protein [Rhizobiaceae bacterium]